MDRDRPQRPISLEAARRRLRGPEVAYCRDLDGYAPEGLVGLLGDGDQEVVGLFGAGHDVNGRAFDAHALTPDEARALACALIECAATVERRTWRHPKGPTDTHG